MKLLKTIQFSGFFALALWLFAPQLKAAGPACAIGGNSQVAATLASYSKQYLAGMKNCTKNLGYGIWDSTGGRAQETMYCIKDPWKCTVEMTESVQMVMGMMTNIHNTMGELRAFFDDDMAWSGFVCRMGSSLMIDASATFFSAGVAAGALAQNMTRILSLLNKMKKLARISGASKKAMQALLKAMPGLSKAKLAKLEEIMNGPPHVRQRFLVACGGC